MTTEPTTLASMLPSIIPAVSGLAGVVLGGSITWIREWWQEKKQTTKEMTYLAVLVLAHLDRFINGCVETAHDDGTCEGRPAGKDGVTHETTVEPPRFEPLKLDVDWKVLPTALMYDILNLPQESEKLAKKVYSAWEFDTPPDYNDMFWTRQQGYAELGLAASDIARRLRKHAGLKNKDPGKGEWNCDEALRIQREKITKARADYEAATASALPDLP